MRECLRTVSASNLLECSSGDAFPETHQIPGAREDVHGVRLVGEGGLHVEDQLDVIDARQVARARRLKRRLRVECEAHAVDVRLRQVRVVLVGDDTAPVERRLLTEARGGVEKELRVGDRVATIDAREVAEVVAALLALTANAEDELKRRVVEGEGNAADLLRLGLEVVLGLDDQLLKVRGRELVALLLVEVDVGDLHLGLEVVGGETKTGAGVADGNVRPRDDDELLEALEVDVDLDAVVGEGREGKGGSRREGEVEGEGDVEVTLLARVADQLRAGVAATRELGETTTRLTRELLPAEEEGTPELVDLLTTDDQLGLVDEEVTRVVAVVAPGVTKLGARGIGAVRLVVRAARELATGAVLLAAPHVLRITERLRLLVRRHVVVVRREVLEKSRLVHLRARVARGAAVHEDGELTTGRETRARLGLGVTGDETRKGHVNVKEVHHVTNTVQEDLTLLTKVGVGVEGLRERLDREARVTLPGGTPEGRLSVTGERLVDETLGKKIVVCARHLCDGVCVCYLTVHRKKIWRHGGTR